MLAACVQKSVSHRATRHTRPLCGTQIPPSQVFVSNRVCCLCTEYRCQCTVVAVRCRGATWCGILTDEVRNYPRAGCRVQDTGYGTNVLFPSCSPLNAIRLQFLIKTWSFWQKKHFLPWNMCACACGIVGSVVYDRLLLHVHSRT